MTKRNKLRLSQLSKAEIEARQMDLLRGGDSGTCGCNCEGSSTNNTNRDANSVTGAHSSSESIYIITCSCDNNGMGWSMEDIRGGTV